ncbi:glycosyltransferase [Nostoc sp. CHAB 5784]|uniref:glycosyltransferase n=1 Tax=Nostoc mirabile TaxID=2907820 RepID=UPI001E2F868C|nr:glycosyltransferase [Nostoc mirabile]MCC5669940.1 glycosyltransferase [Nostoc mirabile CHAB5784]
MEGSLHLEQYSQFVDKVLINEIYLRASSLNGIRVAHINTTAEGGGVAEILQSLIPIMQELGLNHTWEVIRLSDSSQKFMARLLDLLQGGELGVLPQEEQDAHIEELSHSLKPLREIQADVYVVHDFQLAPLAKLSHHIRPAIWFCHVDTANPNPESEKYIRQFLDAYDLYAFNSATSILKGLPQEDVQVISLGINPFSSKNMPLPQSEGLELLTQCKIDVTRPLITQVSRFGKWKNPWQAIDAYRLIKLQIPSVQLALVGAMQALDDVKSAEVLAGLKCYAEGDPDIYLLHDSTLIGEKEVNAFQSFSSVIFQRSSREGFGLTVTEAMWKKQPVVGTSATGLCRQIVHGQNGYIADETEKCANYAIKLIQNRELSHKLGKQAHVFVKNNFLVPMMILDYLKAISKVAKR